MHTEQLERHIIDTIKEWQMKIGYKEENMRLYYPDVSLIGMLELPDGTTEKELKRIWLFLQRSSVNVLARSRSPMWESATV